MMSILTWMFVIEYPGGDTISSAESAVHLVDDSGDGPAEHTFAGTFEAGESLRAGRWARPSRADEVACTAPPSKPDGDNNQLDGYEQAGAHASTVAVVLVHEPFRTVMDSQTIDMSEMPRRFADDRAITSSAGRHRRSTAVTSPAGGKMIASHTSSPAEPASRVEEPVGSSTFLRRR